MLCTFTLALPAVCVCSDQYGCFCSSLISCFPCTLLRYCLCDFEMVPVAPIITSSTFAFTFHMCWICIMWSLYLRIFSASFLITLLSPGIAISINIMVLWAVRKKKKPPVLVCGVSKNRIYCWVITKFCRRKVYRHNTEKCTETTRKSVPT